MLAAGFRRSLVAAAGSALVLTPLPANAMPIVGVSQTRNASASAPNPYVVPTTVSNSSAAPDFSPFDVIVTARSGSPDFGYSSATARHDSSIGPTGITGSFSAGGIPSVLGGEAGADVRFDVIFDVSASIPFELTGIGALASPRRTSPSSSAARAGSSRRAPRASLSSWPTACWRRASTGSWRRYTPSTSIRTCSTPRPSSSRSACPSRAASACSSSGS